MEKPYAESCEQNREPILSVIKPLLAQQQSVLEIGSGTGQHAVYFAQQMPQLTWQPSDQREFLSGIRLWIEDARLTNVAVPIELDVTTSKWPDTTFDAVFSANTLHIMHWHEIQALFREIKNILGKNGLLLIYGPFNYNQQYTSDSNARFDSWLKQRDPQSGIRNFEDINELAEENDLVLVDDFVMPENNRILYWKYTG
ncbi:MAG: DUF938 domain-containing protein [Gammaproteobacteria bacterium]|jgi:cyclopropane fatty-acyl-phospholipid synthase-like methyltransferase